MMQKKMAFALILILLLFTLTGCYDSTGIENFYYIVALGIDKSENGSIRLSVQTAKTESSSSDSSTSQSSDYKIYSVDCDTIDSGINILNNYLNKQINLTHCSAVVFSEEIAKEDIKNYMTALGNNIEIRPTCNVIISSQEAYDVLDKVSNSGENFSARLYEYILNSVEYTGYTIDSTFSNFLAKMNNEQTQATAIYSVVDNKHDTVQNSGTAIFKDNIMVGTISPSQTIAHLILQNDIQTCLISIDNPLNKGETMDIDLQSTKPPSIDVSLVNHTPFIKIELSMDGNIASSGENFDYTANNHLQVVENATNRYLEDLLKEYLYAISKDYNSDIADLGGKLATKFETTDEFEKVHWNEIFKNSYFNVKVNTQISSTHLFNRE